MKKSPILAAGGVLWRPQNGTGDGSRGTVGDVRVAIIHRPRYDDWSLPKGKVDAGETDTVAAVREIEEETGFRAHLGRRLPTVSYHIGDGTRDGAASKDGAAPKDGAATKSGGAAKEGRPVKKVRYWSARAVGGDFSPNDEVDELIWLPPSEAMSRLVYPHDRKVLRRFLAHPADTSTVLIVRHGTAGDRKRYRGDDQKRPLDKHGRAQAEFLVGQLLAFGATELFAADRVRCRQTLDPLAEELGATITDEKALTEEAYADSKTAAHERILEIAATARTPVICTQGRVIPDLIEWWCDRDGVRPDKSRNRKGSTWVLSLAHGKLVAADHISSPLPSKR